MDLNLLVLRTTEPDVLVAFYEALGLRFTAEQHGNGPAHFSCRTGQAILEIYPANGAATTANARIGFLVDNLAQSCTAALRMGGIQHSRATFHAVIEDPAGHRIELTQREQGRGA